MNVVNPKATKTVSVGDSTFTIGIIPYGKRLDLEALAYFNGDAKTKEEVQNLLIQNFEFVRWGVRGHSGVTFQDGSEVPFESKKEKLGEVEHAVVSDGLMEIYGATVGLLTTLAKEISEFNYLKADTSKN